ncbi:uncharacterized protein LOC111115713 isoform X1 [Crassostrea virginica]
MRDSPALQDHCRQSSIRKKPAPQQQQQQPALQQQSQPSETMAAIPSTPAPPMTVVTRSHTPHVTLTKFDGRTSAIQWWLKFMAFIQLQAMSSQQAILSLPFYLTGAAEAWFATLSNEAKASVESIRQAFHDRFRPTSAHNFQLMDVRQGSEETVDDFIFRVSSLTTDHPIDEGWLVTAVVKGLRPRLNAVVIQADPKTLEGVRQEASKAELADPLIAETEDHTRNQTNIAMLNALSDHPHASLSSIGKCSTDRGHKPPPRRHNGEYNNSYQTSNSRAVNTNFNCWYCNGTNHGWKDSLLRKKDMKNEGAGFLKYQLNSSNRQ